MENRSESQAGKKSKRTTFYVRIGISLCALALLVLHRLYPGLFPATQLELACWLLPCCHGF